MSIIESFDKKLEQFRRRKPSITLNVDIGQSQYDININPDFDLEYVIKRFTNNEILQSGDYVVYQGEQRVEKLGTKISELKQDADTKEVWIKIEKIEKEKIRVKEGSVVQETYVQSITTDELETLLKNIERSEKVDQKYQKFHKILESKLDSIRNQALAEAEKVKKTAQQNKVEDGIDGIIKFLTSNDNSQSSLKEKIGKEKFNKLVEINKRLKGGQINQDFVKQINKYLGDILEKLEKREKIITNKKKNSNYNVEQETLFGRLQKLISFTLKYKSDFEELQPQVEALIATNDQLSKFSKRTGIIVVECQQIETLFYNNQNYSSQMQVFKLSVEEYQKKSIISYSLILSLKYQMIKFDHIVSILNSSPFLNMPTILILEFNQFTVAVYSLAGIYNEQAKNQDQFNKGKGFWFDFQNSKPVYSHNKCQSYLISFYNKMITVGSILRITESNKKMQIRFMESDDPIFELQTSYSSSLINKKNLELKSIEILGVKFSDNLDY